MEEKFVTIKEIIEEQGKELQLTLISGQKGLDRKITKSDINRPGLLLAGYQGFFFHERIQVLPLKSNGRQPLSRAL